MSTLKKQADVMVRKLKILAKLEPQDRLQFQVDEIHVQAYTVWSRLSRTFSTESREHVLKGLEKLFDDIDKLTSDYHKEITLMVQRQQLQVIKSGDSKSVSISRYDAKSCADAVHTLQRLKPEISPLTDQDERGFNALKITYEGDKETISGLECLCERIPNIVNSIEKMISMVEDIDTVGASSE